MAKLRIPPAERFEIKRIDEFLGADFSESSDISWSRSPDVRNMIRETPGKVRKWRGFKTMEILPGSINGVHFFFDGTRFIHAGDRIYLDGNEVFKDVARVMSSSCILNGKLMIFDGLRAMVISKDEYDHFSYDYADTIGTVPLTMIALSPKGGGEVLNPVNMLSPKRELRARSNDTDKIFQLPYRDLDMAEVKIKVANDKGTYDDYKEGVQFTVDRAVGKIIFRSVPPKPPLPGEDNIFITLSKTNPLYAKKINSALSCVVYGENGARNRIFCAGKGNRDYHSEFNDPLYFGDISYSLLGSDASNIMGYSVVDDKLATHLDFSEDKTTVVFREGFTFKDRCEFRTCGSCQGEGAVSRHGFAVLGTEPLFPTKLGVYAVAVSDYTSERYGQNRSFYINRLLTKEDLSDSCACRYKDFYMLAAGGKIFALDGLQISRSRNMPYSTRQYECYIRENTGARLIWEEKGCLYAGTAGGEIRKFYDGSGGISDYNDDGRGIHAVWTTPIFTGNDFKNRKKMRSINALLTSAVATSCRIWAVYDGKKELISDYGAQGRYFSFRQLTFSRFTFRTDTSPQKITEKLSGINIENGISFIFENDVVNEPFSLEEISFEFREKR